MAKRDWLFKKKTLLVILWACVSLTLGLVAQEKVETPEEILAKAPSIPSYTIQEYYLAEAVIRHVEQYHYDAAKLDVSRSSRWFYRYFQRLDPYSRFFLTSDLDEFQSYETVLGTDSKKRMEFAFKVYLRFLVRFQEWAGYTIQCLKKTQDYSVKEYLKKEDVFTQAYCETKEEQRELWRKQAKNMLLSYELDLEKLAAKKKAPADENSNVVAPADGNSNVVAPADGKGNVVAPADGKGNVVVPADEEPKLDSLEDYIKNSSDAIAQMYKSRLEVDSVEVLEIFLTALASTYDPHSDYEAPMTKENFDIEMSQSLEGVGIVLSQEGAYVTIVSLIPGGPAERSGQLQEGDRLLSVAQGDGEPVNTVNLGISKVVKLTRGPKGTKVRITVTDSDKMDTRTVTLIREKVKLTSSSAKSEFMTIALPNGEEGHILYVNLPMFYCDFEARSRQEPDYKSSSRDVRKLLEEGKKEKKIDGVVLDLRGNGGGALDDAVALAGLFTDSGPVVQVRYAGKLLDVLMDPDENCVYDGPIMVMVDKNSASASEIVAAALQDMGRAIIVGDKKTHGKGTVQSVYDLNRLGGIFGRIRIGKGGKQREGAGAVKLTVAKYYRINGETTQLKGVTPDIIFPSIWDEGKSGEDSYPDAMKWDTIKPTKYKKQPDTVNVIQKLKQLAAERQAQDLEYQDYVEAVAEVGKSVKKQEIPLNKQERKLLDEQDEALVERLKKYQLRPRAKKAKSKKNDNVDMILNETLRVMGDYIQLKKAE